MTSQFLHYLVLVFASKNITENWRQLFLKEQYRNFKKLNTPVQMVNWIDYSREVLFWSFDIFCYENPSIQIAQPPLWPFICAEKKNAPFTLLTVVKNRGRHKNNAWEGLFLISLNSHLAYMSLKTLFSWTNFNTVQVLK